MIKGYIFDYGGTLDTAGCHWGKVLWHAYTGHRVPVTEQQFRDAYVYAERRLAEKKLIGDSFTFRKTLSVKLDTEMEYLAEKGFWNPEEAELRQKHDDILDDIYEEVRRTTAYSRGVLARIKERCPMVLVSNFYGNLTTVLHEFGLEGLFDDVIESAKAGVRKPDRRMFLLGASALKLVPEEVMAVGDSFTKDIVPASEAGCKTAWLRGEGWTDEEFDEQLPDMIITDISRLVPEGL